MSVTLRKRKNSDGSTSLILDIYQDGKRSYEFLKHLRLSKPGSPADRQKNKENLELAKRIAAKKGHELSTSDYSMTSDSGKKTIITDWMQSFVDTYKKKDKRNLQGALNRFKDFLIEDKKQGLTFGRLNELIISDFQDYLKEHSNGEGGASYFARFKKMVKQAYRQKLIATNPATEVKTIQGIAKRKDALTMDEIKLLAATPTESQEVKKAALFCCVSGLRWIDVSNLKWSNIDGKIMSITQSKTERQISVNLNDTAMKLLGTRGKADDLVFKLPTANGANKTVKAWVKRAGINKKITFHNFRHSFGTNLVFLGTDIINASSLLGHTSLKYMQRYVKAANELKERATDKLNFEL